MSAVYLHRILDYFDGPQVVEARDAIGGNYIGVRVPDEFSGEFVVFGVKPESLEGFRKGAVTLLSLMQSPPSGWQFASIAPNDLGQLVLQECQDGPFPDDCLPGPNYVLHEDENADWLVKEARKENNLVMAVTVAPQESSSETVRIHSDGLGTLLIDLQRLIKYTYARWARDYRKLAVPNGHIFNVRALQPSSLRIILEPSERQNLFGTFEGTPALDILARLFDHTDDPARVVGMVSQEFSGHLAAAYREFLDTLIRQETRVEIAWADPTAESPTIRRMSLAEAKGIRTHLGLVRAVSEETVTLAGTLIETNVRSGTWRIEGPDSSFYGKTAPGGQSLAQVVMDVEYRFNCIEQLEVSGGGSESTVYSMTSYERV